MGAPPDREQVSPAADGGAGAAPLWQRAVSAHPDGVRLSVRLTPNASREAVLGLAEDAGGGVALRCAVTVVPENGKANEALVKMLSRAWKIPKSRVQLLSGATDRRKMLLIAGNPVDVMALLRQKLGG